MNLIFHSGFRMISYCITKSRLYCTFIQNSDKKPNINNIALISLEIIVFF